MVHGILSLGGVAVSKVNIKGVYKSTEDNLTKQVGKGHTGRYIPENLEEKLAMEEAVSNSDLGLQLPVPMTDDRWPSKDGWIKMSQNINGIEIHYVFNTVNKKIDDFKFKD